jgi:hypothetical protein
LKRERVEEGRRANASASLWIVQEEDVNANAPIMVNVKRARVEEVDNDENERGGSKKKNDVLTPPLFLESRNREKEEAARKKRSNQGGPQAVSPSPLGTSPLTSTGPFTVAYTNAALK